MSRGLVSSRVGEVLPWRAERYPHLVRHKTVLPALLALGARGGDLDRLSIPFDLWRSTYPLNRVLPPPPDPDSPVPLSWLLRALQRHRALTHGAVVELMDHMGDRPIVLTTGEAFLVRYPTYARWSHDADLFAADLDSGFKALEGLGGMGFWMHGCKIGRLDRDGDGFVLLKTARLREGHELNVGIAAGGTPSGFVTVPMRDPADSDRRVVEHEGRRFMASTPEQLLAGTALRPLRERLLSDRGVEDVRWILTHEPDLDWDVVIRAVRSERTGAALDQLVVRAEKDEGRRLIPPDVRAGLRPGRFERRLAAMAVLPGRRPAGHGTAAGGRPSRWAYDTWMRQWKLRFLRDRLGTIAAVRIYARERFQIWSLKREANALRAATGASAAIGSAARALRFSRPDLFSACELRATPSPAAHGACLSRLRSRRPQATEAALRRLDPLLAALPDQGQEADLRKRALDGGGQAHRCEAFVVYLGPSPSLA